jgi:RNase H-fold protein (predicted Holliday junction resolvase)
VTAKEKTSHYSTKKKQKQKGNIDSAAAAVVLQEFLDFNLK